MELFETASLGSARLRNRLVKAATFEGRTPRGAVTDELVEFHRRHAAGGVGATTVAYCAVSPEGRTYRDQIVLDDDAVPGLRRLTDVVHAEGAAALVQLGHAGTFANAKVNRRPALGPSRAFSPLGMTLARPASTDELATIRGAFAAAARRAVEAGFDGVEVHVGHGYLLSQFLSPATNRRCDRYGGSAEARSRFPREVLAVVRDGVGARAAVTAKLNMLDGYRRRLDVEDALVAARGIDADGTVDALQLTAGSTSRTPMFLMRGDVPIADLIDQQPSAIQRFGMRVVGRRLMVEYPFEEAFLLPCARRFLGEVSAPLMLLGGVTRPETARAALDEGFAFVAMARALLYEPDLPQRWRGGDAAPSGCDHGNRCVVEMERDGTRCPIAPQGSWSRT
ncbi:MAG: NADH:flavin oxidoreductase [Actinobacteria bacterium]|nr:NADH:flavin oxidoreductase [Actinomycetota bacterium]